MTWISMASELPPFEEKEYLVSDGNYVDVYRWKYFRTTGRKHEWFWTDRDEFFDFNVTHWMPLPQPPKE